MKNSTILHTQKQNTYDKPILNSKEFEDRLFDIALKENPNASYFELQRNIKKRTKRVASYLTREHLDDEKTGGSITSILDYKDGTVTKEGYIGKVKRYSNGQVEFKLYNKPRCAQSTNFSPKNERINLTDLQVRRETIEQLLKEADQSDLDELERLENEKIRLDVMIAQGQEKLKNIAPDVRKRLKQLIETGQAENLEKALTMYENRIINMHKTKRHVMDLALNNKFTHFATFTFAPNPNEKNEFGLEDDYRLKEMQKFLRKLRDKYGKFNYIVVPERHKNGELHFHALMDLPEGVQLVQGTNARTGKPMVRKGYKVYNMPEWKHGWTDVEEIRSNNGVARYVTKYFTKDLALSPVRCGKKKYWQSSGLKTPEVAYLTVEDVYNLMMQDELELNEPNYKNPKVSIYDFKEEECRALVAMIHEKKDINCLGQPRKRKKSVP